TKRDTLDFARFFDFLAFLALDFACGSDPWLSRPESWFDCPFSRLLCAWAAPRRAEAAPRDEPPSDRSPTTCDGPAFPTVAEPPAPPVAVAVCVLVAVFSCLHWFAALVLPVASWLQTAELLPPTGSDTVSPDPE